MPFRTWECPVCETQVTTKTDKPLHCDLPMSQVLIAPKTKFMEKTDAERGKSAMVDQQKILKERARKHSRDVEIPDLIAMNDRKTATDNRWIMSDGKTRKAIDDI